MNDEPDPIDPFDAMLSIVHASLNSDLGKALLKLFDEFGFNSHNSRALTLRVMDMIRTFDA